MSWLRRFWFPCSVGERLVEIGELVGIEEIFRLLRN